MRARTFVSMGLVLLGGVMGGMLAEWLLPVSAARAESAETAADVVVAKSLRLADQQGRVRLILELKHDGSPVCKVLDAKGKVVRTAPLALPGQPQVVQLPAPQGDSGCLVLHPRIGLAADGDGKAK